MRVKNKSVIILYFNLIKTLQRFLIAQAIGN